MGSIKGITVTLYEQTQTGTDAFNDPIYTETAINVDNVLVYPSTQTEILETVAKLFIRLVFQRVTLTTGKTAGLTSLVSPGGLLVFRVKASKT